ncbi:hypothetical protein FOC4_g10010601 [Fusarium odoratissimum]|uniref:Uncharacterized protein n=3 Tax=Fusarium oxysporum species complex TaxID=171631 RepID=N1RPE9_FUSC4|nr:uncharacterized protein FOIG_05547 [Fusarium odoratissimum NRRL 54006]EMT64115.1 hypothetical protein FOC4_g10010601 [Fusarium odoratissimum]EXM03933.1 hypothetical protein FOIG_05547 [Fusarium odoratissimum NRRL 54006]TXC09662.1 hypothetical protein FocTR4_00005661 [Fusarium oxysporum f. sp. cubense]
MPIDEHFGNLDLDSDTSSLNSDPLGPLSYHSPLSGEVRKQYQSIEDEQIVNTALVLFLNALTLHCDYAQGAWTIYRKTFVVKASATKVYEARVDGLLRVKHRTCAIVEVKPLIRYGSEKTLHKIRMQETAQMAAWIAQDPPVLKKPNTKFRRLLLSQDHGEVYLIIATFDYQYVEYICALGTGSRGKGGTHSFLEMREYGPFEVKSPEQMEQLGIILLGASIQGGLWDMFQLRLYHHGVS